MATEIIRVNAEDHAFIMDMGKRMERSASAIISYWVRKQREKNGETFATPAENIKTRKPYERPYDLPLERMKNIPSRLTGERPSMDIDASALNGKNVAQGYSPADFQRPLDNLSEGVEDLLQKEYSNVRVKCSHLLTYALARIAGNKAEELHVETVVLLKGISDYTIIVNEESPGIFLPLTKTSEAVLSIVTISHPKRAKKEYFSREDLWALWACGWNINYQDNVL